MSTYKTVRGKEVHLGRIHLVVDAAGTLTIMVLGAGHAARDEAIELPEPVASEVYNLMGDVMEWESSKNTTENDLGRQGDDAEAQSGELDDAKAAINK